MAVFKPVLCLLMASLLLLGLARALQAQSAPVPPPKPETDAQAAPAARTAEGGALEEPSTQTPLNEEATAAPDDVSDGKMDFLSGFSNAGSAEIHLSATLSENGEPIPFGVAWRIYAQEPDEEGLYPLIASGQGGAWSHMLEAGRYLVHASYGKASATAPIRVEGAPIRKTVILGAGGLRLQAQLSGDIPIAAYKVKFLIRRQDPLGGEETVIVENAKPGLILPLNAGTYLVESQYGNNNAVVRAEITVEEGQLTDATLYHRAAEMTLKLVNEAGGEAIANTKWSLLSKDGNIIRETIGAFPEFILAEGEYTALASHEGRSYSRDFKVEAGIHRDVEVLTAEQ